MEEKKRSHLLRGRKNFLPWKTRIEGLLLIDDVLELKKVTNSENDQELIEAIAIAGANDTDKKKNDKKARKLILENLDDGRETTNMKILLAPL